MSSWGPGSFENDDATDALDAAFERVHGDRYETLMDDRDPTPFDKVQERLASLETLAAAVEALRESFGIDTADWDDEERLAFAGVVVRHAEFRIPIPDDWRLLAIEWLEAEDLEWDEPTIRRLRRSKEIDLLRRPDQPAPPAGS